MSTINNALASKKTSIGAIGTVIQAIGAGMVGYGDGTAELIGIISMIIGAVGQAFAFFNARDNDVRSEQAGPGGSPTIKMLLFLLIPAFVLQSCAPLQDSLTITPAEEVVTFQHRIIDCNKQIEKTEAEIVALTERAGVDGLTDDPDTVAKLELLNARKARYESMKADYQALLDIRCEKYPDLCATDAPENDSHDIVPLAPAESGGGAG